MTIGQMRGFFYHPVVRIIIGAVALFVGLSFLGVFSRDNVPRGAFPIAAGVLIMAYGVFNVGLGIRGLMKKR